MVIAHLTVVFCCAVTSDKQLELESYSVISNQSKDHLKLGNAKKCNFEYFFGSICRHMSLVCTGFWFTIEELNWQQ